MKLLFVCTGNICRSPTAEAVFRQKIHQLGFGQDFETDGCGTDAWHVGEAPDQRAITIARKRGYEMDDLRARQVTQRDFDEFDMIFAMDHGHFNKLMRIAPCGKEHKIKMFLEPLQHELNDLNLPDPYYGEVEGFEKVLNLVEKAADAWLCRLRDEL